MTIKACELKFNKGTSFDVIFQTGEIKRFDMSILFDQYPQLKALKDRKLFTSGKLYAESGIIWNDDLDISIETVYEDGKLVGTKSKTPIMIAADAVKSARAKADISQQELSKLTGIDQSDISKLERGVTNPSIAILERIAKALDCNLSIGFNSDKTVFQYNPLQYKSLEVCEDISSDKLEYHMNIKYPVLLEEESDGTFFISYPDLAGCFSCGSTITEALNLGEDARRAWIKAALLKNKKIPMPSKIKNGYK